MSSTAFEVAIVGGGPGGLMASRYLRRKVGGLCRLTLYEASDRIGGKLVTRTFDRAPAMYEAGVAELYDYSMLGPDPLRALIAHLGLETVPMAAGPVQLDGELLDGLEDVARKFGPRTVAAIEAFRGRCAQLMSRAEYYEGLGADDNEHPWAALTCEELLEREVADPAARRFLKVMARSDLATESHNTNGLNALKNFLMDVEGYVDLYSIKGGNERLIQGLQSEVDAHIELNRRVLGVGKTPAGRYQLTLMGPSGPETRDFDLVLLCLPHSWLATLRWEGEALRRAMVEHIAYFDRPAHYLRVALLFDGPFWGERLAGAWFMSEAFGGCCVYIEGARHDVGEYGVLNWLIAGADALAFSNLSDVELFDAALASLPASLADAREHFVEGKVHRWLSSVNALPGGMPARDVVTNHRPEPQEHAGLLVVGDYLFDSTLNGLLDSADAATDLVQTGLMSLRYARGEGARPVSRAIDEGYFRDYRGLGPYAQVWDRFTDPEHLLRLITLVWGTATESSLLVAGAASGELVGALRARGVDAWGVENDRTAHAATPDALRPYNVLGSITDLPFEPGRFDLVFETSLCHVPQELTTQAIGELQRVVRTGLIFGSVTSDLPLDLIDRHNLLRGVQKLGTWWEWSELILGSGFGLSMSRRDVLDEVWAATLAAGKGPGQWYPDPECLRYSFFDRIAVDGESQ